MNRSSDEDLRGLSDLLMLAMPWLVVNRDLRLFDFNESFARLTGIPEGMKGYLARDAFPNAPGFFSFLEKTMSESRDCHSRVVHFDRSGTLLHVLLDAYALPDDILPGGRMIVCRNVGNVVAMENQVSRTDKLYVVGQVATGIAHEIRNPLTSIRGFLQILHRDLNLKDMMREVRYTELMLAEVDHVNRLLEQLLLLSKPVTRKLEMIRPQDAVTRALGLLQSTGLVESVRADSQLGPTLPVWADGELLAHAVLLLMYNAVEAIENKGNITVATYQQNGDDWVHIDVTDSGPGIPPYMMDRIFDTFYTTKKGGVGLGLPICQKIIADLGGDVRVSAKGFGTTFSVILPAAGGEQR